jgi:DNA polymerase-4
MDAYFAAVEVLANPALRGLPVIVGGHPGSRGVVATASYEARPCGIRPGMPLAEAARRCPHAVFLPGDPPKYVFYSLRLLDLLRSFSPQVEPCSIDEAFVELSGQVPDLAAGRAVAIEIQRAIDRRLRLSASIGVGPNKLVAKMASGVDKPHGITVLDRAAFCRRFWPLATGELLGVGEKTAAALAMLRLRTIGDLAHAPRGDLVRAFGVIGGALRHMARGEDDTPLIPYYKGLPVKSMGHEHTLAHDEADPERLAALLLRLAEQVARRLRQARLTGRTVTVKLRFADFRTITRQRTLDFHTDEAEHIYPVARDLLRRHQAGAPLRLLGVSMSGLAGGAGTEYLFAADRRRRQVIGAADLLRDRFGENVLTRARVLTVRRGAAGSQGDALKRGPARMGRPENDGTQAVESKQDGRPAHRRSLRSRLAGS